MKEQIYQTVYADEIKRTGTVRANGELITITFMHYPNYVKRSAFTGLARSVGRTVASTTRKGTFHSVDTACWVMEPFTFERGEYVSTGRLMKLFGLPTSYADLLEIDE
jgi:hypothetical protein